MQYNVVFLNIRTAYRKTRVEDLREDPKTQDTKEDPITDNHK